MGFFSGGPLFMECSPQETCLAPSVSSLFPSSLLGVGAILWFASGARMSWAGTWEWDQKGERISPVSPLSCACLFLVLRIALHHNRQSMQSLPVNTAAIQLPFISMGLLYGS